jgi:hypothetical protein
MYKFRSYNQTKELFMRKKVMLTVLAGALVASAALAGGSLSLTKVDLPNLAKGGNGNYTLQGGDTFATATAINSVGTWTGTTVGYTDDYDEVCPYSGSTSPDVVYAVTLPAGNYDFDICGSTYDTKFYMYASDQATVVFCNDDFCSNAAGDPYRSAVADVAVDGSTYYLVIDGYGGAEGDYELNIVEHTAPPCEVECPPYGVDEGEGPCYDGYNDTYNGGCNSLPPVFGAIDCGTTVCGLTGVYQHYSGDDTLLYRDTDWYMFTLTDPATDVTWTVVGEVPMLAFLFPDRCHPNEIGHGLMAKVIFNASEGKTS